MPTAASTPECGRAHYRGALDVEHGSVDSQDQVR
jgi:hypothetical protein